jgi:acetyl-CoA carboxylase carboxyl transferase subunit beta
VAETTWTQTDLAQAPKKGVPEGLWMKCPACEETLFKKAVESNLWVCPKCQHHMRVSARTRVEQLLDPGTFEPFDDGLVAVDPLKFVDQRPYGQRIADAQRKTGEKDALLSGFGFVKGRRVVVAVMDFTFLGGSMGSVVGEKITRAIERGIDHDLPVVTVSCSGGARMHESGFSLMQMAKTSAALARLDEASSPSPRRSSASLARASSSRPSARISPRASRPRSSSSRPASSTASSTARTCAPRSAA